MRAVVSFLKVSVSEILPLPCTTRESFIHRADGVFVSPGIASLTVQVRMSPVLPASNRPSIDMSVSTNKLSSGTAKTDV